MIVDPNKDRKGFSLEAVAKEVVSVFESLRAYEGKIFQLKEHLDRLYASAKTCGFEPPQRRCDLREMLAKTALRRAEKASFFRLGVTAKEVSLIVTKREYPPEIFTEGVSVWTAVARKSPSNSVPREAKASCYGPEILAGFEVPPGVFEILLLSQEGYVREARVSNIFVVKNGRCSTPPACGILEGVTRKFVMRLAEKLGLGVREENFTRHELYNADEVFLTNTSGEIIPVREIDGRKMQKDVPGRWTLRLRREFVREVKNAMRVSSGRRTHKGALKKRKME